MIKTTLLLLSLLVWLPAAPAWPAQASQQEPAVSGEKININTGSKAELMKLKGIGPAVADKIIEHRNSHGPFKKPEDIRKVRGVGKGLWEQNRDAITVK
jgi:competence protein ComEA